MKISRVLGRQILDSRGNPTVEAEVWLESGKFGRASVPSGASTGAHEAHELRDGGNPYHGNAVTKAIEFINSEIKDAIMEISADDQNKIDQTLIDLDGTDNKERLGANATLAVSLAVAKAAANERNLPLYKHINDIAHNPKMNIPMPMMNVLNGGRHAVKSADFQEYMIIPVGADSYAKAIQMGAEIFAELKQVIIEMGGTSAVGDEGGFTLEVTSNTEMLDILNAAVQDAGYRLHDDVVYALDIAASEFYDGEYYNLHCENSALTSQELIDYIDKIASNYPIESIEDGLDQDDWDYWEELTSTTGDIQLVGDDLFVTNIDRLNHGIEYKAGNAILIKPNQIGTLSETIEVILRAKEAGWGTIVSHRSGETEDTTIAHLAVGTGAGQIKTGSLSRGERTVKHNELLRIEEGDSSLSIASPYS